MNPKDLNRYLKKSGDSFIYEDNLIENEHGFMSWTVASPDKFIILNMYGDGKYWDTVSIELAKKLGMKKIQSATRRSPRAWEKKYGYKTVGVILEKEVN